MKSRWLRLPRSGDSISNPSGSLPLVASSYSPHCKTYLLIELQTTLLTLDRAVGASVARLVIYIQALRAYTSEPALDINRKYPGSHTSLLSSNNLQESTTVSAYWSILECGITLLAACLPPTSYLFTHLVIPSISKKVRSCLPIMKVPPTRYTPELSRGLTTKHNQWAPYGDGDQNSNASHAGILHSPHLELEQLHTEDLEVGSTRDGILHGPTAES